MTGVQESLLPKMLAIAHSTYPVMLIAYSMLAIWAQLTERIRTINALNLQGKWDTLSQNVYIVHSHAPYDRIQIAKRDFKFLSGNTKNRLESS